MSVVIHAVCVLVGRAGVLIEGPSGAGKTTLGFELVELAQTRFLARPHSGAGWAAFVADDACLLEAANGRLVARAPAAIAGLAERAGLGVVTVAHAPAAIVDLVVRLVAPEAAERMPDAAAASHCGVTLPRLDVAARNAARGARLIFAHPALAKA
jgi:serine kinase of HPr protein (carbohydrate metabolism regulator)